VSGYESGSASHYHSTWALDNDDQAAAVAGISNRAREDAELPRFTLAADGAAGHRIVDEVHVGNR
jgi:hypothetical protein